MIQAAFFVQEKWKTWNSCRVPRLADMEDNPLRVPYIENEIWGSSPRTKLKEGMSSKINFAQFPREPSTAKSAPLHKGAIEYTLWISKRLAPSQKSINDNAPRTPKRQEHVLGRRRNPGTHRGTRLNRSWYGPENVKILLSVRGAGQQDFEELLWGWRIWQSPAHFISSPRPTPRRKKCPRTNEGNPDCQNILPRTTLSSADQDHRRGRRHVARGSPLKDPKGETVTSILNTYS